MRSVDPGPGNRSDLRQRVLTCNVCSNNLHCTSEELLTYTRVGWPKCCRETMTLFIETWIPAEGEADPPSSGYDN
jgi:hypothetical protein